MGKKTADLYKQDSFHEVASTEGQFHRNYTYLQQCHIFVCLSVRLSRYGSHGRKRENGVILSGTNSAPHSLKFT